MKGRRAFILLLVLSIMLGFAETDRMSTEAEAQAKATTIGVEPESIVDPVLGVGSTFSVEIRVRNVVDLAGVEFKLSYDASVLNATLIDYGGIFGPTYFPLISVINNTEGWLHYSIMEMFDEPGFSGNGTAAVIDFTVLSEGESFLDLYDTRLGDSAGKPMSRIEVDAFDDTRPGWEKWGISPYLNKKGDASFINSSISYDIIGDFGFEDAAGQGPVGRAKVQLLCKGSEDENDNIEIFMWNGSTWFSAGSVTPTKDYSWQTIDISHILNTWEEINAAKMYLVHRAVNGAETVEVDMAEITDLIDVLDGYFANVYIHDVAITGVTPSTPDIFVGGSVLVNVTVKNEGNVNETFTVTAYYNNTPVAPSQPVTDMIPRTLRTLTFTWDTTDVPPGPYIISANASIVPDETDTADNTHTDGTVTVSVAPRHDIAVTDVTASPALVVVGQSVSISVIVENEGNVNETFTVTAYYAETPIETQMVTDLTPGSITTLSFDWNTTGLAVGSYTIKATASIIPDETDTEDNELIDGQVEVAPVIHDVAIESVSVSPTTIAVGGSISINVTVKNEGNEEETFNVAAYYDNTAVAPSQTATALAPGDTKTLEFLWNTTGVPLGNYTIRAEVPPVQGETDTADNIYTDGTVTLTVHDVAVVSVTASPALVVVGQSVSISVIVENQGNHTESFSVTVKYDNTVIETANVANLAKGASKTLSFTWNTTGIVVGNYTVSANASVISGETDIADNAYTDGTVVVKLASTISISANPTTFTIGGSTTINGSITPAREEVTVTIWYRLSGEETWNVLETVTTDEDSRYLYDWIPTGVGTYEVKASWVGDTNTLGDESDVETVVVEEAPATLGILLYVVAGIVIVIGVAITIYILKFRKPV